MQALRGPRVAVARACPPSPHRSAPCPLARPIGASRILPPALALPSPSSSSSPRDDATPDSSSAHTTHSHHNHNHKHNNNNTNNHHHGRGHNHHGEHGEHGAAPPPTTATLTAATSTPPPPALPPARPTRPELLAAVRRFVETAFKAVREGPDAAAPELAAQLHPAVTLAADPVRRSPEARGLGALLSELGRLHAEYGPGATHRPILFGASAYDDDDQEQGAGGPASSSPSSSSRAAIGAAVAPVASRPRGYALLEARYQDVNALPGHPATFRVSTVVFLVGVELGPGLPSQQQHNGGGGGGNGQAAGGGGGSGSSQANVMSQHNGGGNSQAANVITRVWFRRQLTYEDRDELLVDPVGVYPAAFPHALLSPLLEGGGGGGGGGNGGDEAAAAQERRDKEEGARAGLAMARAAREWWSAWGPPPRAPRGGGGNHGNGGGRRRHNEGDEEEQQHERGGPPPPQQDAAPASSSPPSTSRLPFALLSENFDFFDAYGLWPTMRQSGHQTSAAAPENAPPPAPPTSSLYLHHAALRGPAAVARYASALSSRYRVHEWRVLDAAPADGAAACFTHWRARLSPLPRRAGSSSSSSSSSSSASSPVPPPPPPPPFVVEGFEVDLFDPPSPSSPPLMRGVYLFRGPLLGSERAVFLAHQRELALQREEEVLSARRAARELALSDAAERLDAYQRWIAGSLRKWGDKVYRAGAAGAAVLFSDEDGGQPPAPPPGPRGAGGGGDAAEGEREREREREEEEDRRRRRREQEGEDLLGPPGV